MFRTRAIALIAASAIILLVRGMAGPGVAAPAPIGLEDGAKQEGRLVVYGSVENETLDAVAKVFTQRYGVAVDYWRAASTKVMDRTLTEFHSGRPAFDVVLTNRGPMEVMKHEGAFATYLSPQNANFPAAYKDPDHVLAPSYRLALIGVLYNTRLVRPEDAPKSLDDFLAPKWRGRWVIPDPTAHFTTGQWLRNLEKLYGPEWLPLVRRLAGTKPILVESFIPAAQKIISGEALAGITYVKYVYFYGKDGAPLDYARLPRMLAEGHSAAISAKAPHPNAARLFENFLISRQGMQILAAQGEFVTAKGVYPPIMDADKIKPVMIDELSAQEFAKWAAVFRPLFVAR